MVFGPAGQTGAAALCQRTGTRSEQATHVNTNKPLDSAPSPMHANMQRYAQPCCCSAGKEKKNEEPKKKKNCAEKTDELRVE
jgi:hypothetical protein